MTIAAIKLYKKNLVNQSTVERRVLHVNISGEIGDRSFFTDGLILKRNRLSEGNFLIEAAQIHCSQISGLGKMILGPEIISLQYQPLCK